MLAAVLMLLGLVGSCSDKGNPANPGGGTKEMDSGTISGSGGTYQHTFATAGTFAYHCSIHPPMTGAVVVDTLSATPLTDAVAMPVGTTNPFPAAHVRVNGTVTWTNNTGTPHTVTSD
jgi:plastocyanin